MLKRLILIVTILVSCVGCDQTTKSVAKTYLSETEAVSLLGGSVRLQIARNYGAFLGMGASMHPLGRTALLSGGVAALLIALFVYCLATTPSNPIVVPALAIVIGGGVSNLLDRLLYEGYVTDYLNIGIGSLRTGIFNVADVFIMSGMFLLIFRERLSKLLITRRSNGS